MTRELTPSQSLYQTLTRELTLPPGGFNNVYCIGRNYSAHAKELGNPTPETMVYFLKTNSSLRSWQSGRVAFSHEEFHHELELVLIVGNNIDSTSTDPTAHIAGVTLGIDVTRRSIQKDAQKKGLPWAEAKSFAGSAVIGYFKPWQPTLLTTPMTFTLRVNDELRQHGSSQEMTYSFTAILNNLLLQQPLIAGDLIFTGTPKGVGPLRVGDRITAECPELALQIDGKY